MRNHRRLWRTALLALVAGLLTGCEEQGPAPISVTGVPPAGVNGSVVEVSLSGETLRIRVEPNTESPEGGTDSLQADSRATVDLTVDGLPRADEWDFDWNAVDTLRAGTSFLPSGPTTRVELYRDGVLVAVIADNVGTRRHVIADTALEAGKPRGGGGNRASAPPSPGREYVNTILLTPAESVSLTPLEPHTFGEAGAQWTFVLLSATAPASGVDSVPETPDEAAEPGALSGEGAPFAADWLLFRVE